MGMEPLAPNISLSPQPEEPGESRRLEGQLEMLQSGAHFAGLSQQQLFNEPRRPYFLVSESGLRARRWAGEPCAKCSGKSGESPLPPRRHFHVGVDALAELVSCISY